MLARWLGSAPERDGASAVLEAVATGMPPAVMSAAEVALAPAAVGAGRGRRERALGGGQDIVLEVLGQKVLHGWLQNRHQTLYPLTVNLRSMAAGPAAALAGMMAVAVLADRQTDEAAAEAATTARAWFVSVGADAAALAAFDRALGEPPALSRVLATVMAEGLSAYAYVVALVSLDPRDPAATHFLDYIAARLALPTTVVRSANRRYRR